MTEQRAPVAQLHHLVGDGVNAQVCILGAGPQRGAQRGVGQPVARQGDEVGIDVTCCHGLHRSGHRL